MENGVDNALNTKITSGVVYNGERGFRVSILWLYIFSISQSFRGFADFGGICSGIPRLNTARQGAPPLHAGGSELGGVPKFKFN